MTGPKRGKTFNSYKVKMISGTILTKSTMSVSYTPTTGSTMTNPTMGLIANVINF